MAGGAKYQVRKKIFMERAGKCERCGRTLYLHGNEKNIKKKRKAFFHHKIFKSNGGNNHPDNLLLTCWPCEVKFHVAYEKEKRRKEKRRLKNG